MSNKSSEENLNPTNKQELLKDINAEIVSVGNINQQNTTNIKNQIIIQGNIPEASPLSASYREVFKPLIENRLTLFGGRSTVLTQINNFINKLSGGYLVIKAPAGFGKTSLMAKLLSEAPETFAYHFFATYEEPRSLTEEGFLRNVVEQMAGWHDYKDTLPEKLSELQALYHNLLDKPLEHSHVLIIDGIDEVNWKISSYVSRRLPDNLHIILTVRDVGQDLTVDYDFHSYQTECLQLEGLSRDDVTDVLQQAGKQTEVFVDNPTFIDEVMRISAYQEQPSLGADPFYVRWLAEDIASGRLNAANISTQPKGLEKYLDAWWQDIKKSAGEQPIKDLFGTLTAALGAINRQDLESINDSLIDDWAADKFDDVLKQVRRFVIGNEERGYTIAHPRLRQYMRSKIKTEAYNRKLLDLCASWHENHSLYALRYYAEHLRNAKQWNELYALAQNKVFADAQRQQIPDEPELPLQVLHIALQTAADRDDAGAIAKFLLMHAKQFLAAESPLEALRKGSLDKAWKLADWCDIEYCILWYLLLAWELKETGCFTEAQATLKRLHQKKLYKFPGYGIASWQGDYAVVFFAHLFEINEDICTSLSHDVLDNFHLRSLYNIFRKNSYFTAALQTVKGINPEIQQVEILISIAKAQVNQGDKKAAQNTLLKALKIIYKFSNDKVYPFQMQWIAEVQMKLLGDMEAARETLASLIEIAETIPNKYQKVRVFIAIADIQIDLEISNEAIQTLEYVENLPGKEDFLKDIAKVLYNLGQKEKALAKFSIAKKIAFEIQDKNKRVNTLGDIAVEQAMLKEFDAALETAEEIDDDLHQSKTLEMILMHQRATEDFTSSLKIINKIKAVSNRINALWQLAKKQVESRKFSDALDTVKISDNKSVQNDILIKVITAQAELGNIPAALENKQHIQDTNLQDKALSVIAKGYAKLKNYDAAYQIIEEINHKFQYMMTLLVEIATVQAESGNISDALKTKDKIEDKHIQQQALSQIAQAYSKAKKYDTALNVAKQLYIPPLRAKTLGAIANQQIDDGIINNAIETFSTNLKLEQQPVISNFYIQACALAELTEIQINKGQKIDVSENISSIYKIVQKLDNSAEKADILTKIANIYVLQENFEDAKLLCNQAFKAAINTSNGRDDQRSKIFELIAQIQVKAGEFDVALKTIELIKIPSHKVNILVTIAQLKSKSDEQERERWKKNITTIPHEIYDPRLFIVMDSSVKFWSTVAVAQAAIGDREAALATFADLLDSAQEQASEEYRKESTIFKTQRELSVIAAGLAKAGEIGIALKITEEIEDASEKLNALWTITWNQFQQGEKITTLAASLEAKDKIKDETKLLEALQIIAQIQAIAGKGQDSVKTADTIIRDRNWYLPSIASWLAQTGDKANFKRLLIPCAYYLDSAYEMCGYLAQLYPEQIGSISEVLKEFN